MRIGLGVRRGPLAHTYIKAHSLAASHSNTLSHTARQFFFHYQSSRVVSRMNRGVLLLLLVCTLTTAMVPRQRRAVNTEEDEALLTTQPPTKMGLTDNICAPQTPCAWAIYRPNTKIIETTIINTYCRCDNGTICRTDEDDSSVNAFVHRCQEPTEEEEVTDS